MPQPDPVALVPEEAADLDLADRLRSARLKALLNPADSGGSPLSPGSDPRTPELDRLLAMVAEIYADSISPGTRAAYARRWKLFEAWCRDHERRSLPATSETVMVYLADSVSEGGSALSTLRGWMAAINRVHAEAGYPQPGQDPAMAMFLKGLSRRVPRSARAEPISALRIGQLRAIAGLVEAHARDLTQVRDRAILGLHLAGVGDGEIARLQWEDVATSSRSMRVTVRPIGRQRRSRSRVVRARKDREACPVAALELWRELSASCVGSVFSLVKGGRMTGEPLTPRRVFAIRRSRLNSLGNGCDTTAAQAMRLLSDAPPLESRDKAILLLGFAGAFRRNEITSLRWGDVVASESGIVVHLRRSKTDQAGKGRDVGIPHGRNLTTCPVKALAIWRARVELQNGPVQPEQYVFVHCGRAGRITDKALTPEALTRLVQSRAIEAGLEGRWGGRSLRAGFISTAADLDIPLEEIASQSRHATLDSLIRYIRREDPFRRNPASRVGL